MELILSEVGHQVLVANRHTKQKKLKEDVQEQEHHHKYQGKEQCNFVTKLILQMFTTVVYEHQKIPSTLSDQ